jgi:hypothetical protein
MNWNLTIRCFGLTLAALAFALTTLAQDASLMQYDGPDRNQKLVAAAQKECNLTL